MGRRFVAVVYNPATLQHRAVIQADTALEFAQACLHETAQGLKVFNASDLIREFPHPWPPEILRRIVARAEGVDEKHVPDGHHLAVHPDTRVVREIVFADPTAIGPTHEFAGHEFHPVGDARPGWKILPDGTRLARAVTGKPNGRVSKVDWFEPDKIPEGWAHESFAKVGQKARGLVLTNHDMGLTGTEF